MDLVYFFAYELKWANPHFAWVSPLVNFKKRLFSNKHKEVIDNHGTNKAASETKLCSHVEETPFFIPMFSGFPKKLGLAHLCLKATIYTDRLKQFFSWSCQQCH